MKYIVAFEFMNEQGRWIKDTYTNNGAGFDYYDARHLAQDFNGKYEAGSIPTRNGRIERLERR